MPAGPTAKMAVRTLAGALTPRLRVAVRVHLPFPENTAKKGIAMKPGSQIFAFVSAMFGPLAGVVQPL